MSGKEGKGKEEEEVPKTKVTRRIKEGMFGSLLSDDALAHAKDPKFVPNSTAYTSLGTDLKNEGAYDAVNASLKQDRFVNKYGDISRLNKAESMYEAVTNPKAFYGKYLASHQQAMALAAEGAKNYFNAMVDKFGYEKADEMAGKKYKLLEKQALDDLDKSFDPAAVKAAKNSLSK